MPGMAPRLHGTTQGRGLDRRRSAANVSVVSSGKARLRAGCLFRAHVTGRACPPGIKPTGHREPIGRGHLFGDACLPSDAFHMQKSMPIEVRSQGPSAPRACQLNHLWPRGSHRCDRTRRRCRAARDASHTRGEPIESATVTVSWSCPRPAFGDQLPRRDEFAPEFMPDRVPQPCQFRMKFSCLREIRVVTGAKADDRRGVGRVLHCHDRDQMMLNHMPRRMQPVGFCAAHVTHPRGTVPVRPSRGDHCRVVSLGCAAAL